MHRADETVIGSEILSSGTSPEIDRLGQAMIKQSDLSAKAALCAGLAALFQTAAILMQRVA